ncbi:MAG: thioredoxin domain-containing protein [Anaerolineales bacterium]|jgi:protein-disulfide isomerase
MTQRDAVRERRRKKKQQQRMVTIMIVAGIALIAVAIIMVPTIIRSYQPVGDFTKPELNSRTMANGNTMGDPNAPVVIEEFSDFGCSHCANFAFGTAEQIVENYITTGQVYYISRSAGNLLNNPYTQKAAEAAYCAADQDMYWEYSDLIFANQGLLFYGGVTYIDNYLNAFADTLDLDMNAFEDCLSNGKYEERVLTDGNDARLAGINSTPSFLINGTLVQGNLPFQDFQVYIDGALEISSN